MPTTPHTIGEIVGKDTHRDLEFRPVASRPVHGLLSAAEVAKYNAEGYLAPVELFSREEISAHDAALSALLSEARARGHDSYGILNWHNIHSAMWDLAYSPRVLDLVEDLIGPDLVCFRAHFFCKPPREEGDERDIPWHQDAPYWPLTPSSCVTVWIAVDDVVLDNAPMRFIPGSHKHGKIPFERDPEWQQKAVLSLSVLDATSGKWGGEAVPVLLRAGQASLHSDMLLHGSTANRSERRRAGLALSYHPPSVRATVDRKLGFGWLCRGRDEGGYWPWRPDRPTKDRIPLLQSGSTKKANL